MQRTYGAKRGLTARVITRWLFCPSAAKLELAVRKELEPVQDIHFLIQIFSDRNNAVLFTFDPDERD